MDSASFIRFREFGLRHRWGCALALFVALVAPTGVACQERLALRGVILEAGTERPVPGARVLLVDVDRDASTGPEGSFWFAAVPAGAHRFRVEALGYRTQEGVVEAGREEPGLVIYLERRPLGLSEVIATGTPLRGSGPYQPGQAIDLAGLSRRSANSFGEILDGEPGLAMRSLGPVTGRPVIRGLDSDRVAVLEGGQRMGDMSETAHDHAIAMEPLLADRVEVVRGPASLLYGSSALGGVVNLLRRDVPMDWAAGMSGGVAMQGATVNRLGAVAGTSLYGSDRWGASARASFRNSGDFRVPGASGRVLGSTHSRLRTGGVGTAWRNDALLLGASIDFHGHVYGIPEGLDDPDEEIEIRSARQRATGLLDWSRADRWVRSVEVRLAGARYFQSEVEQGRASDGSIREEVEHEFERFTMDVGVTATHGPLGPLEEGALGLTLLASSLAATGAEEFHPDGRSASAAVFAFERIPLTRGLTLQAGFRLEHGRTEAAENAFFPGFSASRDATTVSGAVGVSVRPAPDFELGAQWARAHRAPLLEELYSEGPHLGAGRFEIGEPDLRNEVGLGVDVFARFAGDRLQGELAVFHNGIRDYVYPRPTSVTHESSALPIVQWSATEAWFMGGEIALDALVSSAFRIRATGDYVRAAQRDRDRTPLPFVPPARATLGVTYEPGAWWIGGRTRVTTRQNRTPPAQDPTDGYTLIDLQAGIRFGSGAGHTLSIRIDNVRDVAYRDHLSRVDERRFPMPGRNVSAIYRWDF